MQTLYPVQVNNVAKRTCATGKRSALGLADQEEPLLLRFSTCRVAVTEALSLCFLCKPNYCFMILRTGRPSMQRNTDQAGRGILSSTNEAITTARAPLRMQAEHATAAESLDAKLAPWNREAVDTTREA